MIIETAEMVDANGLVLINGLIEYSGQKNHIGVIYREWLAAGNEPTPYTEPESSIEQQIFELESQVTPEIYRKAFLSGDYSFIQDIDDQITTLRLTTEESE